jgi:hypothetical protein
LFVVVLVDTAEEEGRSHTLVVGIVPRGGAGGGCCSGVGNDWVVFTLGGRSILVFIVYNKYNFAIVEGKKETLVVRVSPFSLSHTHTIWLLPQRETIMGLLLVVANETNSFLMMRMDSRRRLYLLLDDRKS